MDVCFLHPHCFVLLFPHERAERAEAVRGAKRLVHTYTQMEILKYITGPSADVSVPNSLSSCVLPTAVRTQPNYGRKSIIG